MPYECRREDMTGWGHLLSTKQRFVNYDSYIWTYHLHDGVSPRKRPPTLYRSKRPILETPLKVFTFPLQSLSPEVP